MRFIILLFALLYSFPLTASQPIVVTYGLYAGGFNVVDIKGTYTLKKDTYDLTMDLYTTGLLGKLAPWSGIIKTHGLSHNGIDATPLHHSFAATWRGETKTNLFDYDENGHLISYKKIDHDGKEKDKTPDSELYKDHPVDMLSALFRTMRHQSCETTQPVFDGKRRFDMVFKSQETVKLEKTKYSIFEGPAEICELEIVPVAGHWREKPRGWMSIQGQAKRQGQLPRMWFGTIAEDQPPIPVRFQIKTDYGTMIMHLKSIDQS